jgi:hypothetical protein
LCDLDLKGNKKLDFSKIACALLSVLVISMNSSNKKKISPSSEILKKRINDHDESELDSEMS